MDFPRLTPMENDILARMHEFSDETFLRALITFMTYPAFPMPQKYPTTDVKWKSINQWKGVSAVIKQSLGLEKYNFVYPSEVLEARLNVLRERYARNDLGEIPSEIWHKVFRGNLLPGEGSSDAGGGTSTDAEISDEKSGKKVPPVHGGDHDPPPTMHEISSEEEHDDPPFKSDGGEPLKSSGESGDDQKDANERKRNRSETDSTLDDGKKHSKGPDDKDPEGGKGGDDKKKNKRACPKLSDICRIS